MASETLEDKKQEGEAEAAPEVESKDKEDGQTEVNETKEEESHELSEKNEVPKETDEHEEKEEEPKDKEEPKKGKRSRKSRVNKRIEESSKLQKTSRDLDESKKEKEPEPVTPGSERPTRERKIVERYSAPTSGRSVTKSVSIEKVRRRSQEFYMIKLVVILCCSDCMRICEFSRAVAHSLRIFQTVWLKFIFINLVRFQESVVYWKLRPLDGHYSICFKLIMI